MKQIEKKELMHRRADELANSGRFESWGLIEIALRHEGFTKARLWLDDRFRRSELDDLCRQARSKSM